MSGRRALEQCSLGILGLLIPACIGPPLIVAPEQLPIGVEGTAYRQELWVDGAADSWRIAAGELPPGLTLTSGGGVITGTPTAAGTFEFTVRAQDAPPAARSGERAYTLTILPRLKLEATLAAARVDTPYSSTPSASGGVPPYRFEIVGLPAGLTFDPASGTISGTPLNPYDGLPLEITVTDSGALLQTASVRATLVVRPPRVVITTTELPDGEINALYLAQVAVANGRPPYRWAVTAGVLPDGLRLDTFTGVIFGMPERAQTAVFTIEVEDRDTPPLTDSREFTITIEP